MAFSYGFFNAKNLDRVYTAEDFTSYLSSLICNGILDTYGDNFSVTASDNLSIIIGTGKAWIGGHYFINDTAYTLDLRQYVDESLSRYVLIGISCDVGDSVRACKLEVRSGTAATSPSTPVFENTETKTYLTLAAILLPGGASGIAADQITDYRDDESKCGYVKCILGKCKVTQMLAEIEQIRQDISGLQNGSLSAEIKELQHYLFNTAEELTFEKDEDGNLFYLDSEGSKVTGDIKIDGIPYQFASDGTLYTGFRTVFGKRYYYAPDTGNIQLGWVNWAGKTYYITLYEGKIVNQHRTIDGVRYWFDSDGNATEDPQESQ